MFERREELTTILENYLLNEDVPICRENCIQYIDSHLAEYLVRIEKVEYLDYDVFGPQINETVENVLMDFRDEKRIFNGKKAKFYLQDVYAIHSARLFEAKPITLDILTREELRD